MGSNRTLPEDDHKLNDSPSTSKVYGEDKQCSSILRQFHLRSR